MGNGETQKKLGGGGGGSLYGSTMCYSSTANIVDESGMKKDQTATIKHK